MKHINTIVWETWNVSRFVNEKLAWDEWIVRKK